ncbi:retinol dehydrogenase 11-like [Nymphalis io]|uniref:retinol dehydrogenase 11-like n=1 Tax=Inachis io TaxID=171585 RepID=UPI002167DC9C|nr:retinol dehydrogenase 11-like [Nymphalis io]XP_050353770.1 retinol dehydrogenase 11-like [Nymphalis io]XP_050353772.1 retinol dehydrogenase 11-like [Nymphalis io]XP_050353773.1 retinol dehydrogenase 11-like [Nymphalis io]XP_050353774.1 retinol dehydrogenase 11-like [Nymphalis io]XP_050353775.1 retinol dehydrogenase 11-like [Nymphalis io]XP_050353776.1 retinol dehydrogenase 11-like [Nymphalis io]XP_050353777.1 retinol dehydrogenase 11-like [Nymphalis io]XP_050353778.1 retinol dehydrogenas
MWFLSWIIIVLLSIKIFNKLSTGRCYMDTVMSGKVVVVTGASGGIGFETALELARRGAKLIIACRSHEKGEKAVRKIVKITNNKRIRFIHLDLTSLKSVRSFVDELKATEVKLDVLINNAGAICTTRERTEDGILKDLQINYLGPFLLTVLLVPMLKNAAPSRVVVVSSSWHKFGTVDNLNSEKYGYIQSYANTKLCNVLFSKELARRLEGTGVDVNSLNPGQVNTSLYRSSTVLEKIRSLLLYSFFKTPEEGAQTSIYLAVSHECDQISGEYFEDCRQAKASYRADDEEVALKLWAMSQELVKLTPDEMNACFSDVVS